MIELEKIMLEISKGAIVVGCGGFLRELKKILPEIETLEGQYEYL